MTNKQIWQTIALDLKRAANYLHSGRKVQSEYYSSEAKKLFESQKLNQKFEKIMKYIKFDGDAEDLLLGSSLISSRLVRSL